MRLAVLGFAAAGLLVGCDFTMAGGLLGGLVALALAAGLLFTGGATTTGCGGIIGPCLSPVPPADASVPSDAAPRSDATAPASAAPKSAAPPTVAPASAPSSEDHLRICLSEIDISPCLEAPYIGPCLEAPNPEAGGTELRRPAEGALDRAAIVARLSASLPADVVARLKGDA